MNRFADIEWFTYLLDVYEDSPDWYIRLTEFKYSFRPHIATVQSIGEPVHFPSGMYAVPITALRNAEHENGGEDWQVELAIMIAGSLPYFVVETNYTPELSDYDRVVIEATVLTYIGHLLLHVYSQNGYNCLGLDTSFRGKKLPSTVTYRSELLTTLEAALADFGLTQFDLFDWLPRGDLKKLSRTKQLLTPEALEELPIGVELGERFTDAVRAKWIDAE